MFQNYQFSLKKINKHFSFHYLIYILFIKYCFCEANDNAYSSNFANEEIITVDSEEIIRRQNVAKSYLKENSYGKKDWIDTYHESFSGNSVLRLRKTMQQSSLDNEHEIHITFPFQNEGLSSLKKMDDSVHPHESLFNGKDFNANPKDETMSSKKVSDEMHDFSQAHKNDKVSQYSLNRDNDETLNSHVSMEISDVNKIAYKYPGKSHSKSRSKSNKLKTFYKSCEMFKDSESDSNVKYFNFIKNTDSNFGRGEFKNLSVNTNKIIQIMLNNSEFTSEKYFINGEMLTLTEYYKLQENLASLSFLQSKNNVYSINRMNIIDSIGKVTLSFKQDRFFLGDNDDIINKPFHYKENNVKKSKTDFKKCVGSEIAIQSKIKDSSSSNTINNEKHMLFSSLERSNTKDFPRDSEMLRRKKMMNTFVTTLNNQENWIETYHLNDLEHKSERKSLQKTVRQNDKFSKAYSQERLYIIRWINKLKNKLKGSHDYHSLSVLVSADLNKILNDLSQEFDIVVFDELVNNMISNATLHNSYANALYFDYEYIFNLSSLNSAKFYIFIAFLFCSILLYNLSNTRPTNNFVMHKIIFAFLMHYKWILLISLFIFSFSWHGYKMYQQKIAEKHSVMARVVPSYCESILIKESGVVAHFKEYFRNWYHSEDCKVYYEAVMIDPSSEINPISISTDLLADTIFQILRPFARNINSSFKTLMYNLSFTQQFLIVIIAFFTLIIILYYILSFFAFHSNYKINFPFNLGSVEPTEFYKGSRVEEVKERNSLTGNFSTSCDASLVNYNNEIGNKNKIEEIVLKENAFKIECGHYKLYQSKDCVLKTPRTRRNSF